MDVTCTCGTVFQARSAKARYCSDRCRKRKVKADVVVELMTSALVGPGPVATATQRELEQAGRFDSALGQACMAMARRLDSPGVDTGSALAAVAARLEGLLTSATRGAGKATSPQQLRDELADRRAKHA